jgi:uncharacterized protein
MINKKKYLDYNTYLRNTFGCKVHKVVVDAGFSCPNRDGSLSFGGCIYCNEKGSGAGKGNVSIKDQVLKGVACVGKLCKAKKFVVYFQSFSNTHAPVQVLEEKYKQALCHKDIVGLAIGTRPDCIDDDKLALLNDIGEDYDVWIEYGLQSCHNKTLKLINRHHSFEQFLLAIAKTKKFKNIKICAHIIFGLPGETQQDMLKTVKMLAPIGLDGIKFHSLYVEKNTEIEKIYTEKPFCLMSMDEYVDIVCKAIKLLPKDIVFQRLTGECLKENLIAPKWLLEKQTVLTKINFNL